MALFATQFTGRVANFYSTYPRPQRRQRSSYETVLPHERERQAVIERYQRILRTYTVEEPNIVMPMLLKRDKLSQTVDDGIVQVARFFGEETEVTLAPFYDFEGSVELTAYIHVGTMGVDEALRRLQAFDQGWLLDQPALVRKTLVFTLFFDEI